jgi:hypothetical protein
MYCELTFVKEKLQFFDTPGIPGGAAIRFVSHLAVWLMKGKFDVYLVFTVTFQGGKVDFLISNTC